MMDTFWFCMRITVAYLIPGALVGVAAGGSPVMGLLGGLIGVIVFRNWIVGYD